MLGEAMYESYCVGRAVAAGPPPSAIVIRLNRLSLPHVPDHENSAFKFAVLKVRNEKQNRTSFLLSLKSNTSLLTTVAVVFCGTSITQGVARLTLALHPC